jgi:hypothetical protein
MMSPTVGVGSESVGNITGSTTTGGSAGRPTTLVVVNVPDHEVSPAFEAVTVTCSG